MIRLISAIFSGLIIFSFISFISVFLVSSFKLLISISLFFSFFGSILFDDILTVFLSLYEFFLLFVKEIFVNLEISFISFVSLFI